MKLLENYFKQLTEMEILQLQKLYKIDIDIFGYSDPANELIWDAFSTNTRSPISQRVINDWMNPKKIVSIYLMIIIVHIFKITFQSCYKYNHVHIK